MVDKFGNPLAIGDHVVYADSGRRGILHRGTIETLDAQLVAIRSERNTLVHRRPNQIVLYTGGLVRFYAKEELQPLIQYRGDSEHTEWALWIGDIFIIQKDGQPFKMQHPEDNLGLPVFNPYKDPVL